MDSQVAVRRFLGAALVTVGVFLVTLCGACTALFGGVSLFQIIAGQGEDGEFSANSMLSASLMVGVPPIVFGAALIYLGRWLRRPRPPPSSAPPPR